MRSLIILALGVAGALAHRWRGYGEGIAPREIRRLSFCLLPIAAVYQYGYLAMIGVGVLSYLGVIVGHGRYFTLGRGPYPFRQDNWPGKMIEPLGLERPYHDALALSITGLAFTLPLMMFSLYQGNVVMACAAYVAGVGKCLAYEYGWRVNVYKDRLINCELMHGLWCFVMLATGMFAF